MPVEGLLLLPKQARGPALVTHADRPTLGEPADLVDLFLGKEARCDVMDVRMGRMPPLVAIERVPATWRS
ncbi:MAG: hypothetical protein AB1673_01975 [Actinomycetota bacterium]